MPVSLKFLHFQKRADFSVHESGFGKEKGNIFRAYFFVKGKRIPDRAVGLLENKIVLVLFCKPLCQPVKHSFDIPVRSGIKPVSINGKDHPSGFKDTLPLPDRAGRLLECPEKVFVHNQIKGTVFKWKIFRVSVE